MSNSTAVMSTPATPSTSAWCVLESSANRGSGCDPAEAPFEAAAPSPSTSQISQSGFVRSSCCANTRLARFFSCSSLPGGGSAVERTWYLRLKWGSSTHTGRPWPYGTNRSF